MLYHLNSHILTPSVNLSDLFTLHFSMLSTVEDINFYYVLLHKEQ